ncbi:MAG: flavodoxin family protein [Planctomycetota bacterium]
MNLLGFSAGSVGRMGNVDRMVQAILDASGHEAEFVKLAELSYSGCKGCVQRCAGPQVCVLEDDLLPYYQKIRDADGVVVGATVYFDSLNGMAFSFLERFFGYRHVTIPIAGKPFIVVVAGALSTETAGEQARHMLEDFFQARVRSVVRFETRVPPCFKCGRHRQCRIGGLYAMMGDAALDLTIKPEMFTRWEDDEQARSAVEEAAQLLREL